ncbi:tetratricopeptide repeat protein 8 [Ischnura elegans]|uniref:tetratricopeptide repeat protein 8 n=1 Tax=Ischnura elegans TaxID=197161 RepID=UPI001ED8874D|nr:tetratricopeptide repeat protein 8 [Ischnura elegans]
MLDPLCCALMLFRARKYDACIKKCSSILRSNPHHKGARVLMLQCEVEASLVDDWALESDGPGGEGTLATALLVHSETYASSTTPGTSLRSAATPSLITGGASIPVGSRPLSRGVVRGPSAAPLPRTAASLRTALRTAHSSSRLTPGTATSLRPLTTTTAGNRAGAAPHLGPWIVGRAITEATTPGVAKTVFEYILIKEGNAFKAMELALEAAKVCRSGDISWWEEQIGRCLALTGQLREARIALRASMGLPPGGDGVYSERQVSERQRSHGAEPRRRTLSGVLRLSRVDARLDQPLAAISVCLAALGHFPGDITLLIEIARLYEALGDEEMSIKFYKDVLQNDPVNIEALACMAAYYYYKEQPDMAMQFYRHLMQLGICTVEVLCNMALCCLGMQQLDLVLPYLFKAIALAEASDDLEIISQVWYNASHIAINVGDIVLATKCLKLCISNNPNHSPAFNNLAILELMSSDNAERSEGTSGGSSNIQGQWLDIMGAHLKTAHSLAPDDFEPAYNLAIILDKIGDTQASLSLAVKAHRADPNHVECKNLMEQLQSRLTL